MNATKQHDSPGPTAPGPSSSVTTTPSGASGGLSETVQTRRRRKIKLLYLFAYGVFIFIPLLAVTSMYLFVSGWQTRSDAIESALCNAFLGDTIPPESKTGCVETKASLLHGAIARPSLRDIVDNGNTHTRLARPEVFALGTPTPTLPVTRCKELTISKFDLIRVSTSQDATYDSIVRRIEACNQPDTGKLLRLCSGTRTPHESRFCRKSFEFLENMQVFDRSYEGRTATLSLIVANVCFGAFQLAALLLMLCGVNLAIRRRLRIGAPSNPRVRDEINKNLDFALSPGVCALDAAYFAQSRAQSDDEQKRLQTFRMHQDAFRGQIASAFSRINAWGDVVILIGLLGTLWGMLTLFSALAESGSAEPLTAELAKSKMFGSLGLAFGTTIFAGILRLIYMFIIPRLKAEAEETIDRTFLAYFSGVTFEMLSIHAAHQGHTFGNAPTSYIARGRAISGATKISPRPVIREMIFSSRPRLLRLFSIIALSVILIAALTIVAIHSA